MNNELILIMNQAQINELSKMIEEMPFKYASPLHNLIQPCVKPIQDEAEEQKEQKEESKKK